MTPLHRHQLAWLGEAGWHRVLDHAWDAPARDCLAHWAAHSLPLVVTRQPEPTGGARLALGLPAPGRWGRRRLALTVPRGDLLRLGEFPLADQVLDLLPVAVQPAWRGLCAALNAAPAVARVYGSCGWQWLSGLDYLREGSDIDLWLAVSGAAQADAAAACLHAAAAAAARLHTAAEAAARLHAAAGALPRLDGELVFDDGGAVAWREWLAWRGGRVKSLLVKRIDGSALLPSWPWQATPSPAGACLTPIVRAA